jgi:dTDP-4-dehydrorhamnose 3,5-epimerase
MTPRPTDLPGVVLVELAAFRDPRGQFAETYQRDRYRAAGITAEFVQDNASSSRRGVLRGLHYRVGRPEGKLVHVTRGEVFDVAVDIRRSSPTFGRWFGTVLSADNRCQLWIPPGFAHGFLALTDADLAYKITETYAPGDERAIRWDDPDLAIAWPLGGPGGEPGDRIDPLLSPKDAAAPAFAASELLP